MAQNYGSKRIVVGAHYGLRDWLSQRITAAVMAVFTLLLLVQYVFPSYARGPGGERLKDAAGNTISLGGYEKWAGIFASQWMKFLTLVVIVSLAWHAWVGMRLALQVLTIVWLVGCAGWAVQVLWRL